MEVTRRPFVATAATRSEDSENSFEITRREYAPDRSMQSKDTASQVKRSPFVPTKRSQARGSLVGSTLGVGSTSAPDDVQIAAGNSMSEQYYGDPSHDHGAPGMCAHCGAATHGHMQGQGYGQGQMQGQGDWLGLGYAGQGQQQQQQQPPMQAVPLGHSEPQGRPPLPPPAGQSTAGGAGSVAAAAKANAALKKEPGKEEKGSLRALLWKCGPCCLIIMVVFLLIVILSALGSQGKLVAPSNQGGNKNNNNNGAAASLAPNPVEIVRDCIEPNMVAITFEGGPAAFTHDIMDMLEAAGAKGTFFVTGNEAGCIFSRTSEIRRMRRSGHQIGSRGWTGRSLSALSKAAADRELQLLESALGNITGVRPAYIRPPGGLYSADTLTILSSRYGNEATLGLWSVDGKDWDGDARFFESAHTAVTSQRFRESGPVTLLHDSSWNAARVYLPWVLAWAKNNSLQMVPLGACAGYPEPSFWYTDMAKVPRVPADTTAKACRDLELSIPEPA